MPRKILIVDDNKINRQVLINALQDDYDIIEARDGNEALEQISRNYKELSAVLLDIVMPYLNGYEVLSRVREDSRFSEIPIIMVTGSEDEASRVKALSFGANDFITKPFTPDIVKHCLKNNIALKETASTLNAIQKDKLTGLYNRETFFEKVVELIQSKEPGYYILSSFDIDNFKLVNDQYGADEGDQILREIGRIVKNDMNEMDGIACRISADNFAALFPVKNKETTILLKSPNLNSISLDKMYVVISVGRYIVTDKSLSASAIYDRAFLAKQSVKGRYDQHMAYFDESMLQKLIQDQQIVSDMEAALTEHQFEIWFQPQYNHVTGALTGAESLVRWRHPQKGLIPPNDFIPLFEQNGFIYELDKYVWRETCRHLRRWTDEGLTPPPASVNVSRYDVFRVDFIDTLTGIVNEYGIPFDRLRIEITESAFAISTKTIVAIVKQLVTLGFTVEIDDFGSGYSSLNTLKSVPAQVIKLDMRFLEDADSEGRGGSILESIVRMTKWLGMLVVAEGVETIEQSSFLKSIGCSHVQGYLYARPMPADEYEKHFVDSNKQNRLPSLITEGNMDSNMFWNPQSMDSLIFNSYVGAACIFEYHNGTIELLRVTDKYLNMLDSKTLTVESLLKIDLAEHLCSINSTLSLAELDATLRKTGSATGEFLFLDLPGCPHETFIRSVLQVIARTEDRYITYCISENITAQRIAERKETAIKNQMQIILDSIDVGITAVKYNGKKTKILLANDRFFKLFGYTRLQFRKEIGSNPEKLICPDDRDYITSIIAATAASGESASIEYRALRRDGGTVWIRSNISVTSFENEDNVQLCTYADISAEKHTAQDLLDNLPCGAGICVLNGGGANMVYLNKRYYTYFKHRNSARRSQSVYSVIHPDDRETVHEAMRPAFERGGEGSCVARILDGPDTYIPFRITGLAIETDNNDKSIYVTFVPLSQEMMSVGEMLPIAMKKMMETSNDLSFLKDSNLRYIGCSDACLRSFGYKSEHDIVGKTARELCDAETADRYEAEDRQVLETGESVIDIVSSVRIDDKIRYYCTSKYPLCNSRGEVIGIYGVGRDITKTREAEERQEFLINNIPGGIAIYEGQWNSLQSIKLSYFSDGFARLFGYTHEEYEQLGYANPTGLVTKEFIPGLVAQIESLVKNGTPIDYIYRARSKDRDNLWIHIKAVLGENHGNNMTVNAVLFDVTEQQETLDLLRISEEENRIALQHRRNVLCRYDIATKTLRVSTNTNPIFELPAILTNVPFSQVDNGRISPETADDYTGFFEKIIKGGKNIHAVYQRMSSLGWRWVEAQASTIFSSDGAPLSAIITFDDVTESFEKEAAYKKWMQSLRNKSPKDYTLFRCNVSKKTIFDTVEGSLLDIKFTPGSFKFDKHTDEYTEQYVMDDDKEMFHDFLSVDSILKKYYNGERIIKLDYRESVKSGGYRWLRLTVDLVEYSHSADVEAYILFENIDEAKRTELLTIERAETDPLTGVLNRTTFEEKVNERISGSTPGTRHAMLMLDIDGFKQVNDVFGHSVGDQTLIGIASLLRKSLRSNDLVSRLGGDEFLVFLSDIPNEMIALNIAKQICELSRKSFSAQVHISVSIGIALAPEDGTHFDVLYKKADNALYYIKDSGGDSVAFYHDDIKDAHLTPEQDADDNTESGIYGKKRRMLIVDDNRIDCELLADIFRNEFIIEKAKDGSAALIRLRHYGSAISIVLLDLIMPGIDGFTVIANMQQSPEMRSIPVIVVSASDDRETSLRAIREGATDFVNKPVDPDVLRIRVLSAISKSENERLRAKNRLLELQNSEVARYKTVIDRIGISIAELDWGNSSFTYDASFHEHIAGKYDGRSLWRILLSDLVADAKTVKKLQQLVHNLAEDRGRTEKSMTAKLKTPSGQQQLFIITMYKLENEYGLTDKMIITFRESNDGE